MAIAIATSNHQSIYIYINKFYILVILVEFVFTLTDDESEKTSNTKNPIGIEYAVNSTQILDNIQNIFEQIPLPGLPNKNIKTNSKLDTEGPIHII